MPEQLPLVLGHRVALGVEDFLVAPSNRHAVDWIDRWPDWPFTALVVAGPPGSGKTHLAELWRARADAQAIELASAASILEQGTAIAAAARTAVVDDADHAAGNPEAEVALLRLYNLLRAAGGQLLLTSASPPSEWGLALADLSSRLNSAMVVTIDAPDDALLASVALKLFADRQLTVAEGVILLLLSHGERSFAAIARAVAALDQAALAAKRPITIVLAREILAGLG